MCVKINKLPMINIYKTLFLEIILVAFFLLKTQPVYTQKVKRKETSFIDSFFNTNLANKDKPKKKEHIEEATNNSSRNSKSFAGKIFTTVKMK